MQRQSTLDVLGHQPRERLTIIGTRTADRTGFYPAVAFAYAARQRKIPKAPIQHVIAAGAAILLAIR